MKKIVVYGQPDILPLSGDINVEYESLDSVPEGADCIIVSQEFTGNSLEAVLAEAEKLNISVLAVTTNSDAENQEYLLGLGAEDVVTLPVCAELLSKRIKNLNSLYRESSRVLSDLSRPEDLYVENGGMGSLKVPQHDFINLYRFVLRLLERMEVSAQMLVFSLNFKDAPADDSQLTDLLSSAVHKCLRRGDISTKCESGRIVVILLGANDDGGHLVANRIVSNFYSECDDENYKLTYDICEIRPVK